jgi:hypothetical protein
MALKLLSQLHRGLPDRLILAEYGIAFFAEIKTTGKKPTRLQKHCHELLRKLGFQVFIIDTTDSLEMALALMDRAVIAERIKREEFGDGSGQWNRESIRFPTADSWDMIEGPMGNSSSTRRKRRSYG